MQASMRSRACRVTTGPISTPGAVPGPILSVRARSASAGTISSATEPTSTATLARRSVCGADEAVHGLAEIRVGHHHGMVFRAAESLDPLAARGALLIDVPCDGRRADEAQRLQ